MISEGHVVPFSCGWFPDGSWLVFAPHADDETFGMGGALLKAAWLGVRTQLVVMTDGAQGGSAQDLVQVREDEARRAAQALGMHEVTFIHEPDRRLTPSPELASRLAALISVQRPALVFFPGLFEPHPDHRATALLVWAALQQLPADQRPIPVTYEISVQGQVNLLVDVTDWMQQKQQVVAIYHSQLQENRYLELSAALNKLRTFTLGADVQHAEGFHVFAPAALEQTLLDVMTQRLATLAGT
jgi:LmbE family N-acetylglucosaminyl deacetylase